MTSLPAPIGSHALQTADRISLLAAGARGAILTPAGGIAATFTLSGYDKKLHIATYLFRVLNESIEEVVCVVYGLTNYGTPELVYPVPITVQASSLSETEVSVPIQGFGSFERVMAEVRSEHGVFSIEAPALPRRTSVVPKITLAATSAIALLAAAALGLQASVPRVAGFSLPPSALAGSTVEAEYATSGLGALTYSVDAPDGSRLAQGVLTDHTGTVRFTLPKSHDPNTYTMRLNLTGPLGVNSEVRVVSAMPLPKPKIVINPGAAISNIEVDPVVAHPGDLVHVKYLATGTDGYLRMLDSHGTIWSQVPSANDGSSYMRVPLFDRDRELRVLLHVRRGTSTAQSSAGLIVIASKNAVDPDSVPAHDSGAENGIFSVASTNVRSGGTVKVHVLTPRNGLRIALTDTQSHEITGVNVGIDQEVVYLRAPDIKIAARYVVVATFADGFGQESVVAPIVVAP